MDTKLCPFCLHSNEDWEDWLYFCIRGCLPKNLFRNVLASKWHLSLKCPNGLSVGKWNQEVVCHNLKKKRTKLVLRNIWRRVFCRSLTRCCHCHYTSYRPMLFLYCFHNCWNWLKNREDILRFTYFPILCSCCTWLFWYLSLFILNLTKLLRSLNPPSVVENCLMVVSWFLWRGSWPFGLLFQV